MEARTHDKLFYKIGEVASLTALKPSILRYWETEFCDLQPNKSRSGQRLYAKKDLELVIEIKKLLYTDKLTIEGARRVLARHRRGGEVEVINASSPTSYLLQVVREVKDELKRIKAML
jgi:DNA-binding transcriptional MerR regulator